MVFRRLSAIFFTWVLLTLTAFGSSAEPAGISERLNLADHFTVYYFHGNFRPETGKKLEQYVGDALLKYFGKEIKQGLLNFLPANVDLPENRHFLADYQAYPKALIIVAFKNRKPLKWQNLDKVWRHLNRKTDFYTYIHVETRKFME